MSTGDDVTRHLLTDTSLWGMNEIAANLYYSVQSIRTLRKDGKLPEPDATPSGRPAWYAGTIRRWAMDTGRMDPDGKICHLKPTGRPKGSRTKTRRPS